MTRRVRAYHGTTLNAALQIADRATPFKLSQNGKDWLGRGIYFYEEDLTRAVKWAYGRVEQLKDTGQTEAPAVIVADLDLTACLDLCSVRWANSLANLANSLQVGSSQAVPMQHGPRLQTAAGQWITIADREFPIGTACDNHADALLVDALYQQLLDKGEPVTAKRGAFQCGRQLYTNSYFFDETHVQIAVLDHAIISIDRIIRPAPRD